MDEEPDRTVELEFRREYAVTVWIALALSVFVTVITALAGRGTITANGLVGIRTRATQSSDAAWRAGHRAATPVLVGLTIVTAVAAVIVLVATHDSSSDATNMNRPLGPRAGRYRHRRRRGARQLSRGRYRPG